MVLAQNEYKNTLVGVLRTKTTFVTHSSPSCYVTLRTQTISWVLRKLTRVFLLLYLRKELKLLLMDRCKLSELEVVKGVPERVHLPCLCNENY